MWICFYIELFHDFNWGLTWYFLAYAPSVRGGYRGGRGGPPGMVARGAVVPRPPFVPAGGARGAVRGFHPYRRGGVWILRLLSILEFINIVGSIIFVSYTHNITNQSPIIFLFCCCPFLVSTVAVQPLRVFCFVYFRLLEFTGHQNTFAISP